ncbi:multidrug resistance-associated protein 5 isoform X2 [Cryptotermes secundus]|uniref:multidrug resistance-associated protein 5 isoform X2 n=1 Tax=Cryptotermes secundus TaxID=105785 RepID=UPI001454BC64|nr:multidrug resistance-associated protein 5 isoform X2 [Cryptotermes secundus]XP_033609844.1 multidrug resistance-associated protein 5 isoform X2 [Cryptotermes secundus]
MLRGWLPCHCDLNIRCTPSSSPKKRNKYGPALKHFIPIRPSPSDSRAMPSNSSGFFSFVAVSWMTGLMWKAYRHGLSEEDLYDLQASDRAEPNAHRLERLWHEHVAQNGEKSSLSHVMWRFCRTRCIVAMVFMAFAVVFQFLGPALIQQFILQYVEDKSVPLWWGLTLVFILFWCQLLRNYCFGAGYVMGLHTAIRVQGAVQHLIYKKMLLLRSGGERVLGQVLTFCTNEQERLFEACHMGILLLTTPVMFVMCLTYSLLVLGPWALVGNIVILLFYPIMGAIANVTSMVRIKTVKVTDQRVGLMSEILNSIRLIKMYAWEDSFANKIADVRNMERKQLQTAAFLQSFSNTITPAITLLASISTFLGYSFTGNNLFATEAFTIFSVFTAMQFTVGTLPYGIKCLAEANVSCQKLQKFVLRPNYESPVIKSVGRNIIEIKDGTFSWEASQLDEPRKKGQRKKHQSKQGQKMTNGIGATAEEKGQFISSEENQPIETLHNIELEVSRGKLVGVCGSVGSGKSSLLSAIMGDMIISSGQLYVMGSMAIVSQQAWIFNDTVRENILFGLPFEETKYQAVVECCSLQRDLELLANGDKTEISEGGSNLSGGQKQRINLARAVYADKDLYLLDDPLSAVDAKVARNIFNRCIKNKLKDKTILLVTHGMQFLEQCDEVLYMKDGLISERGTHEELVSQGGDYCQMLQFDQIRDQKTTNEVDTEHPLHMEGAENELAGKLTSEEAHTMTQTGWKAYVDYAKFCGGYFVMAMLLLLVLLFTLSRMSTGIWLQIWLDQGDGLEAERKENITRYNLTNMTEEELKGYVNDNPDLWFYQLMYGLTFGIMLFIGLMKGIGIARQLLLGSSRLHDTMFRKVIRCPVSFFDVTPPGRILQRFSRDMDELDVRVPFFFEFVWQGLMFVITQMLLVCVIFPVFSAAMIVATALFMFLDVWLNVGLRETKKLDNLLKSPVLNHMSSTMAGLSVIRTFGRQKIFLERFCARLNRTLASDFIFRSSVRWFTFRMDMIAVVIVTLTGLVVVLLRDSVTAAQSGLALSCVFAVSTFVPFVMQLKSEMQARFTSVERILEYTQDLPEEAAGKVETQRPPDNWPWSGQITMEDVQLRYRPDLPLVLHGVTVDIKGGEKVGVVGRTGAGKSSLVTTLLRLTELAGGRILIDGIDISTIGLHDLRSAVAIIPQDPVLFQGTIRYNLDPFGEHSDDKIWEALDKAHLKEKISREEKQLLCPVEVDGENLSVGEKQLICLARALLRKNKILLLDEATASVDVETDHLIQETIHDAFGHCTVLTIAHRLNTVTAYDRVMVMDSGKVTEFDTPENLMNCGDSLFRQMMLAMGISSLRDSSAT